MSPGIIMMCIGTILMFATPAMRMIEQRHHAQRIEETQPPRTP